MKITIHQTDQIIGDFAAIYDYCEMAIKKNIEGLHLFPELFLAGYPLADLCLQKEFISNYQRSLKKISALFLQLPSNNKQAYLMGGLDYEFDEVGKLSKIRNSIFHFTPGKEYQNIYSKQLLPDYDIFDEKKYFTSGNQSILWDFSGTTIAPLICEDMWHSPFHERRDPIDQLVELISKDTKKRKIDLVINLSASPFYLGKTKERQERAQKVANTLAAPLVYVNRVGGEDEILFDGNSFGVNFLDNKLLLQCSSFAADCKTVEVDLPRKASALSPPTASIHVWRELLHPHLNATTPPTLPSWNDQECETVLQALMFGLQEYARKAGMTNFLVANSGGIDSALVLAITKLSLKNGQRLEAIYMPGQHSATLSYELAYALAKNLNVKITSASIKFIHSTIKNSYLQDFNNPLKGVADENVQSRIRGLILYAHSNQGNFMVINTSNKSELAVGYSTLYGDSVGAISLLGDMYKSEVYSLANYINRKYNNPIPEKIITRAPTAELRENQTDAQSLPPYDFLDPILEGILSYSMDKESLSQAGFDSTLIDKVYDLYRKSEFKRYQFCPIIKIKKKSFGRGYRVPISKK